MSLASKTYNASPRWELEGDVFTSPQVVRHILDLIGYTSDKDLSEYHILEPSCGEGAFLIEIIHRVLFSARRHNFDPYPIIENNIVAYDIDHCKIERCRQHIQSIFSDYPLPCLRAKDFLQEDTPEKYDFVVGNPPYIRYEKIPAATRTAYKKEFATFHYRADLYVLFFEKTLKSLKPGGKHGFICANRWLRNEYGKKLRGFIARNFRLHAIVDLEQANAFQEKVLAYPAITIISNESPSTLFNYTRIDSMDQLGWSKPTARKMSDTEDWSQMFCDIAHGKALYSIEEQGFHIGIGTATGADNIYISSSLKDIVEEELLLPAINARDLTGNKKSWHGEYLLNPYSEEGHLIDLSCYPRAKSYLENNKNILSNRHVAKKNPAKWYRTIDKVKQGLLKTPKILIPDISGNSLLFIDEGHFYPLHNIYYITGEDIHSLKILCAILMSDFVSKQIQYMSNCMNGGYPRWQSQHLRKLRIPYIKGIIPEQASLLEEAYDKENIHQINDCMKILIQSQHPRKEKVTAKPIQLSLSFS